MISILADAVPGQVILLNGVSSSGKTSLARQLLRDLDRPFFHIGVDMIGALRSEPQTHQLDQVALQQVLYRTRAGFHRAVAAMALAGNDIVMDHVFSEPWRLRDCLQVMTGIDVVLIGVHCSPEELAAARNTEETAPPVLRRRSWLIRMRTASMTAKSIPAHRTWPTARPRFGSVLVLG